MKTKIIVAIVVTAATLVSFTLTSDSTKDSSQEKVASTTSSAPAGGMAVAEIQR